MFSEVPGTSVGVASWGGQREDLVVLAGSGVVAGVTTTSSAAAASCRWTRARLPGPVRAIVINSGNANAATGLQGQRDNETMARVAAEGLGCPVDEVLVCSTGVIGVPLDMARIQPAIRAAAQLRGGDAASAILTTDLCTKTAWAEGGGAVIGGIAKGSGMIHPNMATMLAFVATDACVDAETLQRLVEDICGRSFNAITVDGDCSTNDTFLVQATGVGVALEPGGVGWAAFAAALEEVCITLAKAIAADGEGAEHLVEVVVEGLDDVRATAAARAVCRSSLVKSAVHGRDANWGRVVGALGAAGVPHLDRLDLDFAGIAVLREGAPVAFDEDEATAALSAAEVQIRARLPGDGRGVAWGCDLSAEYVRINADYRS
jgi:glutamate N-acetyltransferase / amino-acid N-acetyltransferase